MKTALISLLAATFIGLVSHASGAFDAAHFLAALLATGLVIWTIEHYGREPRPLSVARPIRLSPPLGLRLPAAPARRLAA